MTIHLKPELEALVQQDIRRGPYESADEFVEQAIQMLHRQEQWFADNREDIAAKVEEGYASAQRGELTGSDQVRDRMERRKRAWLSDKSRA